MSSSETKNIDQHAEGILKRINMLGNPYFNQLKSGEMSIETFRETQTQFFYAVKFFSRPMSALIARIPEGQARLTILQNIIEEHGDLSEAKFHAHTFQVFLQSIGQKELDFNKITIWPQVRAFNSVLATSCLLDEIEIGIACLGIIERAFAEISALIGQAVINNEWVAEAELTHYNLHAALDIKHAADFFDIIEPYWQDETKQHFIKQGLELGAYIFYRLYRDLIDYKVS